MNIDTYKYIYIYILCKYIYYVYIIFIYVIYENYIYIVFSEEEKNTTSEVPSGT